MNRPHLDRSSPAPLFGRHWTIPIHSKVVACPRLFHLSPTFPSSWLVLLCTLSSAFQQLTAAPGEPAVSSHLSPTFSDFLCPRLSHTLSKDSSNHTSIWSPATKNLQPGGRPRNRIASGQRSERCWVCNGAKKAGSCESSSPHQMYHPFVSPVGGCLRPFIGIFPWVAIAKPNFDPRLLGT